MSVRLKEDGKEIDMSTAGKIFDYCKNHPKLILGVFTFCFFTIYSFLYFNNQNIFLSPDENAVAVFTDNFSSTGSLVLSSEAGLADVVHPRSVNLINRTFVPGSFIGFILLLGGLSKIVGENYVIFIPSLIAVLAVVSFYSILKRIFQEETAFLSGVILFFLPQWWWYSSRSYLPNVVFVGTMLIGVCLLILAHEKQKTKWALAFASGLLMGIGLSIRLNEIWWLFITAIICYVYLRKRISYKLLLVSFLGFTIPMCILFYYNWLTYGAWIYTGYNQFGSTNTVENPITIYSQILNSFFPFGIKISVSLWRFWVYQFQIFWWQTVLLLWGLALWFQEKKYAIRTQRLYLLIVAIISVYLILYYGSMNVLDHPDQTRVSLGIAYVRYWIPIYLGGVPFMAWGINKLRGKVKFIVIGLFCGLSVFYVYGYLDDNLSDLRANIVKYKEIQNMVISKSTSDSVIISERNDKIFWPKRDVIHYQDQDYTFVSQLDKIHRPLFILTTLPKEHVQVIEESEFAKYGLNLVEVGEAFDEYYLYQINKDG